MAIETFDYDRQAGATGTVDYRVREIVFGDGYTQAIQDGLNNEIQTWPLSFVGNLTAMQPIIDFFRRHKGAKAFYWTPPGSTQGLYRVMTFSITSVGSGVYSISADLKQVFSP